MNDLHLETEEGSASAQVATDAQGTNGIGTRALATLDKLKTLAAKPVEIKQVALPAEYSDIVWWIRKGKVSEREAWEKENTVKKNGKESMSRENVRANLLYKASINEDRSRMFESAKQAQTIINDLPGDLVEYVFDEVIEYWGIKKKDADEIAGGNS